ncbi:cytochrome P450 CYP72A219-like [Silene latifolia]|uniref:cytochrome P450 CYP72A219-like n=1 Tax=Silene latifolia TaxID=37657 RepID=UPI003D770449
MEFMLVFSTLFVIAITFVAWHFIYSLWLRPKKLEHFLRKQGFGGNSYRPINGDLVEINQMTQSALSKPMSPLSHDLMSRLAPFAQKMVDLHGMNSFVWYGRKPKVNIMKPELIREIFTKHDVFCKQPPGTRSGFGLVLRDGEDWARVRRIINPAFHMDKLKNMLPLMNVSVDAMLRKWEEMRDSKGTIEMDVYTSLTDMAGDVITRTAFGSSYEEGKKLFELEHTSLCLKFELMKSIYNYIPGWRYVPTMTKRKVKKIDEQTRGLAKEMVDSRKRGIKEGENASKDDLLSIMLESNEKDIEEHGVGLTMQELIAECRLFLLAGKDTTASLLTWTLVLLTQHQDWQSKAREEVLQHFGKDKIPDFEGLTSLKVVTMILHETLRFYPPVPGLSRVIAKDSKLKNFSLLREMEVNIPTILIHRDEEIWGSDANEFNPSRFSKGVASASNVQGSFLPFGGGPRICIGQNFALMEAKLALARILQRFSFQLSPSYVHSPVPLVGLVPQYGAPLILYKI